MNKNETVKLYMSDGGMLYIMYGNKTEYYSKYYNKWRTSIFSQTELVHKLFIRLEYLGEL